MSETGQENTTANIKDISLLKEEPRSLVLAERGGGNGRAMLNLTTEREKENDERAISSANNN
jgi:hypothetical protein